MFFFYMFFILGFRSFSSLGNPTREHTSVKRFEVRGHERVQRGTDVRRGSSYFLRPERSTGRVLHHHISIYIVLFYRHAFLSVHTKSE